MKEGEKVASIYELTNDFMVLQEILSNDPDSEEALQMFDDLDKKIEEKADGYARIIRNFESDIEGFKAEEARLKEKRAGLEKAVDRLKTALKEAMIKTDKRKFKTDLFSFNIAKNGGALPVVVDVPTEELADEFVIVTEKPDLKAIAKYIEETGDITQFHFGERGESLRIK